MWLQKRTGLRDSKHYRIPAKGEHAGVSVFDRYALAAVSEEGPCRRGGKSFPRQSLGRHTRNYLAAVAAINSEICIGGQDDGISERFGHANEASVGEAHGDVGVFLHEPQDWLYVVGEVERGDQGMPAKECAETWRAASAKQVERF
jgi:hypothetical protein